MSRAYLSRRGVLVGMLITGAVAGVSPDVIAQDQSFDDDLQEHEIISGREARIETEERMNVVLKFFEKRYGIKYSEQDKEKIRSATWDRTKEVLAERYIIVDP